MKACFSRKYELSAAHRLFLPHWSNAENAALFGKCANPFGHGHNYRITVTAYGRIDEVTGMVCDMVTLDSSVQQLVLLQYDHSNLNQHPDFATIVPTTENFCIAVYNRLKPGLAARQIELAEVRIDETANNSFVYAGGGPNLEATQQARFQARPGDQRRQA